MPGELADVVTIVRALTSALPFPIDTAARLACWYVDRAPAAAAAYAQALRS